MTISKEKIPVNQSSVFYLLPGPGQDEMSLLDVLQSLRRQWKFLLVVTLLVTLIALTVGLMMPTIYRAEANLLSPSASSVESLNIPEFYEISMDDLYGSMIRNLKSKKLRRDFFEKYSLFEKLKGEQKDDRTAQEIFREKFDEMLKVEQVTEDDPVVITLDSQDPQQTRLWLDGFIDLVNIFTVQAVVDTIKARAKEQLTVLRNRVGSLRAAAEKYKKDRIVSLEENLLIAQKLNIKKQKITSSSSVGAYSENFKENDKLYTAVTNDYLIGEEALKAEIAKLKSRKNVDSFIPGLRKLQGEIFFLEHIDLQYKNIHAARIDQPAELLDKPVKPNLKLFVAIGFILGGITAVSLSLLRSMLYMDVKKQVP